MTGYIHSIETFGTVDGPGIRVVVFMQGCTLRCLYCHNPDTWKLNTGDIYNYLDLLKIILKYKNYIKSTGGVTFSGGEPLLQLDFLILILKELKKEGLHTCIDTSGICFDENNLKYQELIKYVDLFLVDIKHMDEKSSCKLTSKSNKICFKFLDFLNKHHKDVWIRYVIIPTITDNIDDLKKLNDYINSKDNIKKIELIPYHKHGISKYEKLGIEYKLKNIEVPTDLKNYEKLFRKV